MQNHEVELKSSTENSLYSLSSPFKHESVLEEYEYLLKESNLEDQNLTIALSKASRICTQKPVYLISQFVSNHGFSPWHKLFLDSIDIPKTTKEALKTKIRYKL